MIDAAVFLGSPLRYNKFTIYAPKVNDVVNNPNFNQYVRLLTFSQEELEDEFADKDLDMKDLPTPLEFLLANCYNSEQFSQLANQAFLFFFGSEVKFLYEIKSIVLTNSIADAKEVDDMIIINEDNFFILQNLIRRVCCITEVEPPNPNLHPKIRAMKAKARLRDKIKAKQGGGISFTTSLIAICCMGLGITPLNIGEMSYASVSAIINMYQEKEKYDIDIKSLLAGADSKKIKPKYWIRNLD